MTQHKVRYGLKATRLSFIAFALMTLLSTSGCQKSEDDSAKFSSIYTKTLGSTTCKTCHVPGGSAWNDNDVRLDFSTQANAYASLTSGFAVGDSSALTCGSVRIVSPGNPAASYLAGVVVSSYNTPNFAVSGCTPIADHVLNQFASQAEQDAILTWIKNGAKND